MEKSHLTMSKYIFKNKGNNKIGDTGCKHLSKAEWKNLRELYLGINLIIKDKTKSEILDATTSVEQTGKI